MNIDFAFRTEKGNDIGSGHFFRSLSLANVLQERNFKIIFLMSNKNGVEILEKLQIPHIILKGDTEEKCIQECKTILLDVKKLVIDLPIEYDIYGEKLGTFCETIILDDLGNKKINSKILINGSLVKKYYNYDFDDKLSDVFLGPEYMMIRKEFLIQREKMPKSNDSIKNILLIFGGGDEQDLLRKILPFFYNTKYKITVVIGTNYSHIQELENIANKTTNISINISPQNIAELFSMQDLVISSSGITSYELASLGIPTILIPAVPHQEPTAEEFAKRGFGINYGHWDNNFKRLENTIKQLNSYKSRKQMSENGRKIVDGQGISRVLKIII